MKLIIKVFRSIFGIIYLIITVTIAVILFMDIGAWGDALYKKMDYKVSERFLGGETISIIDNGSYFTRIHSPVFDGIFKSRNKGFIQIDWLSNEILPSYISENIDFNNDRIIDFRIDLYPDENKAFLEKYNNNVVNLLDRTSMGTLVLRGYDDGRYCIFNFHGYEEAAFLGHSIEKFQTLNDIFELVDLDYKELFGNFLNNIDKNGLIVIEMIGKFGNKEKVRVTNDVIKFKSKNKNRISFNLIDNKKNEELVIITTINNINDVSSISPKTSFKYGKSVRVILNKNIKG